jgi:polysaccharide pyruvyl transferase WcaK-like protein
MDLMKNLPDLEYINTDNVDIMLKEYARAEFTIAMKMHSCILSFASGTPFFTPYYDWKSIEYLKMIHWSDFGVNCFTDYYEYMKEKVDDLIENSKYYIKQFEKIKKIEQVEFDRMIDNVCEIIVSQK